MTSQILLFESRTYGPFIYDITVSPQASRDAQKIEKEKKVAWSMLDLALRLGPDFITAPPQPKEMQEEVVKLEVEYSKVFSATDLLNEAAGAVAHMGEKHARQVRRWRADHDTYLRGLFHVEYAIQEGKPAQEVLLALPHYAEMRDFYYQQFDGFFTMTEETVHSW